MRFSNGKNRIHRRDQRAHLFELFKSSFVGLGSHLDWPDRNKTCLPSQAVDCRLHFARFFFDL